MYIGERTQLPAALITGACGVMGVAVTRRLAERHLVYVADINAEAAEQTAVALRREGASAIPVQVDVTSDQSVAAMMDVVRSNSGTLKTLAHVVALGPSSAAYDVLLAVNLAGAARVVDACEPVLQPGGAAVLIGSVGAHMVKPDEAMAAALDEPLHPDLAKRVLAAYGSEPGGVAAYSLAKNGMMRMTRRLAPLWGQTEKRITTISPGFIATDMGAREFEANPAKHDFMKRMPIPRQGSVIEIADGVEFLASDRASYITGCDLLIDGGMSAIL